MAFPFIHWSHGVSFYPLLLSFCLQITYKKVRNLQIVGDKLVEMMLINLVHHTVTAFIISTIIIDTEQSVLLVCTGKKKSHMYIATVIQNVNRTFRTWQ